MKRAESQPVSRRAARAARGHARLAAKRGDELWPSIPNAHPLLFCEGAYSWIVRSDRAVFTLSEVGKAGLRPGLVWCQPATVRPPKPQPDWYLGPIISGRRGHIGALVQTPIFGVDRNDKV